MRRKRRTTGSATRRPRVEQLESRWLLATDALVAIDLEIIDATGNTVEQVDVGEGFTLRGHTRDLRLSGKGVFSVYTDVTYDAALATTAGTRPD